MKEKLIEFLKVAVRADGKYFKVDTFHYDPQDNIIAMEGEAENEIGTNIPMLWQTNGRPFSTHGGLALVKKEKI